MDTLRLDCRCGAYLEQRERNPMRLDMAREEFEAQHHACNVTERDYCPTCDKGGCFAEEGSDPPRHHRCRTVLLNPSRTKKGED